MNGRDPRPEGEPESLEEALTRAERGLQERYYQIGKEMLELADREQRKIDQLLEQIIDLRTKLAKREHKIRCPHCDTYTDADSIYCKRCGGKMKGETP